MRQRDSQSKKEKPTTIDLKSGASEAWHSLQVSAYEHGIPTKFDFDPEKHEYRLDGRVIPSVTTILRDMGEISEFSMQSERARERGTMVHIAASFLPDNLDWSSIESSIFGYVMSAALWFEKTGCKVEAQEQQIYLPDLDVAGTLDLRGSFQGGKSGTLYLQADGSLAKFKAADTRRGYQIFVSMVNVWRYRQGV